jgi:AcrR family transcriptional regulator
MPRPRLIPDTTIFAAILQLLEQGGERSIAFSSVARATGLAAPSLVQRYGSLPQMIEQALAGEWQRIEAMTASALAEVQAADKGPQALLKALSPGPGAALLAASSRHAELAARAAAWAGSVQTALAERTGDPERAAMLFALWSGQSLWQNLSPRGFRLKDAIKRLG